MIGTLPHTSASGAWAYTAGEGKVRVRPKANQTALWEPTRAARERFQGTPAPTGKRLHHDEAFASMQRRGLVESRTPEKKRMYMVRDIIKDTNLLDHSMFKAPHAYRAHQGILGATEKIKNETIVRKPQVIVDRKQAWHSAFVCHPVHSGSM